MTDVFYYRDRSRAQIRWEPADSELAELATLDVVDDIGLTVSSGTAAEIRERYKELHINKYGQESVYYEAD